MASVLIAAVSARALAASAARAGYRPLVADLFGDVDTRAIAARHEVLPRGLGVGLRRGSLIAALERLAEGEAPIGVVCGAGFEARAGVLASVGRRFRLLGSPAPVVRLAKRPDRFAAICAAAGVAHPRIAGVAPEAEGWLDRRVGGGGGGHIRPADPARPASPRRYAQARAAGRPVSALVLGNGASARALCTSAQWADPLPDAPFRYGGAVRPASLPAPAEAAFMGAAERIAAAVGLVGLGSVDALWDERGLTVLEMNPRPGATVDLCDDRAGTLFALHLAGCDGELGGPLPGWPEAAGAAYVYAPRRLRVPDGMAWPDWTADRGDPGSLIPKGAPVCTVLAEARSAEAARAALTVRHDEILTRLEDP